MNNRPVKIDELTIEDHYYLTLGEDDCYYFGSYYKDYRNPSPDNDHSLISNLKKKPSMALLPGYHYKNAAIIKVAAFFNASFSDEKLQSVTLVPIPPSKIKGHAEYDDRMLKILQIAFKGRSADIRELVEQIESTESTHTLGVRLTISEIEGNIRINENLADALKETIFLVDDVLTSGTHFKAIKNVLTKRFPNVRVAGIFVCRRVIEA
ncbi:MAG TPA: hypothetical protein VF581_02520 [Flavobacterium sp.]|jgi:predicted amidophosphoribosyltransferase